MTERYEKDKLYKAFIDMYSYNYATEGIKNIYDCVIKEYYNNEISKSNMITINDVVADWYNNEGLNFVWGMLVLMFGDYGTSPRSGWLNVSKDLIDFLKDVLEDLEEMFKY